MPEVKSVVAATPHKGASVRRTAVPRKSARARLLQATLSLVLSVTFDKHVFRQLNTGTQQLSLPSLFLDFILLTFFPSVPCMQMGALLLLVF